MEGRLSSVPGILGALCFQLSEVWSFGENRRAGRIFSLCHGRLSSGTEAEGSFMVVRGAPTAAAGEVLSRLTWSQGAGSPFSVPGRRLELPRSGQLRGSEPGEGWADREAVSLLLEQELKVHLLARRKRKRLKEGKV